MKSHHRIAAATVATVLAVTVTGCGRDGKGRASDTPAPVKPLSTNADKPLTGDLSVWGIGAEGEKLAVLAEDFEAANPGTNVKVTSIPWDGAHNKIQAAVAARTTPDIGMFGTTWMPEFAKAGALDPTPPNVIDKGRFFDGAWSAVVVDGTAYGIPYYVDTRVLYYRKDLLAKAGAQPPKTWDELVAMGNAVKERAGADFGTSFSIGPGNWQTLLPFLWAAGGELVKDGRVTLDTPEMITALTYMKTLYDGKLAPTSLAPEQMEKDFVNGKTASFVSGPWEGEVLKKLGGDGFDAKWDVVPMPKGAKSATSFAGGGDLGVFKDTKNRDLSWKFVEYIARPEVQAKFYTLQNSLPAAKDAWKQPALLSAPKLRAFETQLADAKAPPSIATWEQLVQVLDDEAAKVAKSGAKPAEVASAMQKKADAIGTGN